MDYLPIENYGVIGDLRTVGLVSLHGSLDFLCLPEFDSPSIFAALLDHARGGSFAIHPSADCEVVKYKQLYMPDTNVLQTHFLCEKGVAELTDFMPVRDDDEEAQCVMRRVTCIRGELTFDLVCAPRFDYARASHEMRLDQGDVVMTSPAPNACTLRLCGEAELEIRDTDACGRFVLREGESASFILLARPATPQAIDDPAQHFETHLRRTEAFWQEWIGHCTYEGRWLEIVHRSALVLKLLTSRRHGSLVAAPTFSLPEALQGRRNWDYRFTWLRDAAFSISALMELGFRKEAEGFINWLVRRCEEIPDAGPPLQVMYRIDGGHDLDEQTLDHLEGYRGSRPVRIGNAAATQLQLDVYGELIEAIYVSDLRGYHPITYDLWKYIRRIVEWVCQNWERADSGIWEGRGPIRHFLHSRLMCWVAIDRAWRLARRRSIPAPLDHWRTTRDAIYEDIYENFWNEDKGAFVRHRGGDDLDAASLMMPLVDFIAPTDPRWRSHLRAIERELVTDALVYRYHSRADRMGLEPEGTFSMCSFWYVQNLALAGEQDKARFFLDKMLAFANHLGLYSEELSLQGEQLGNFPQALTHLALVHAAMTVNEAFRREHPHRA